jgi:hypothetical protein
MGVLDEQQKLYRKLNQMTNSGPLKMLCWTQTVDSAGRRARRGREA